MTIEEDVKRGKQIHMTTKDFFDVTPNECQHCYGYGLWAIGAPSPMGPMDASDGYPTIPCKNCGSDANPIEKWKKLK